MKVFSKEAFLKSIGVGRKDSLMRWVNECDGRPVEFDKKRSEWMCGEYIIHPDWIVEK